MQKKRILLIDDHPLMRHGLAQLLEREPDLEVCGEAGSSKEAVEMARQCKPDLAIVDISLSDGRVSGLSLINDLRLTCGSIPILVLSMHDENLYAERALQAGATGYVMKQEPATQILHAIKRLLGGGYYLSERLTQTILQRHVGRTPDHPRTPEDALSLRELEVFRLLGEGMRPREIAACMALSVKTIEAHRANIRRKLGLGNSADLARRAIRFVHQGADPEGETR